MKHHNLAWLLVGIGLVGCNPYANLCQTVARCSPTPVSYAQCLKRYPVFAKVSHKTGYESQFQRFTRCVQAIRPYDPQCSARFARCAAEIPYALLQELYRSP